MTATDPNKCNECGFCADECQSRIFSLAPGRGLSKDRNIYGAVMLGHPKHRYRKGIARRPREMRWL
jgi:hypothetical protein